MKFVLRKAGRAVVVALWLMAGLAVSAESVITTWHLLQDPKFKSIYYQALGPKVKQSWLAKLNGPSPPVRMVTIDGVEYQLISACKNHDCGDNNTVVLYSAAKGVVYGTIYERGKTTLIGVPSPGITAELNRLWQTEWR